MSTFELPDNLSELSSEELEALHEGALTEARDIYENQPRTAEGLERMKELKQHAETISAEREVRAATDQEMAGILSELDPPKATEEEAEETEPAAEPEPETEPAPEGEPAPEQDPAPEADPAAPEPTAGDVSTASEPAPAPAAPAPQTPEATPVAGDTTPSTPEADTAPVTTQEPATVAASASTPPAGGTPSAAALNAHRSTATDPVTVEEEPTPERRAAIVAAANLPEIDTGHEIDMLQAAEALHSRIRSFPTNNRPGQMRAGVFAIRKPFTEDEIVPDGAYADRYFDEAADESKLPGGNLVAAGGWCAPSETLYDMVADETVDGILSLPSRQISRGGIKHTLGPDFRTIYDGSGFTFTEADDIAGDYQPSNPNATGKACVVIPCPDWTEDRLDVAGLCVTGGILQNVAYPEATRRFLDGTLVGHAHRMNSLIIDDVVAGSDAVAPTAFGSATTSLLSAMELVGTDIRYRHRMAQNQSLEVVLPIWAKGVVRADLSNRLGINMLDVSDAMIDAWFRERMVNPQYVYDWQDDMIDGTGFGAEVAITAWPTTVDFLIYKAGTWVKGESDVITVDAIYDSVNLPANNYTALFTEEGYLVAKRGHDSRIVTVTGYGDFGDVNAGTPSAA